MGPETEICTIAHWCLSRAEWVSLWGGFGGAAFAFSAAVCFEWLRRTWRERAVRRKLGKTMAELQTILLHFCNIDFIKNEAKKREINTPELKRVWNAVFEARSAIRWALGNAALADTDLWRELDMLWNVFETRSDLINAAFERMQIGDRSPTNQETYHFAIAVTNPVMRALAEV